MGLKQNHSKHELKIKNKKKKKRKIGLLARKKKKKVHQIRVSAQDDDG